MVNVDEENDTVDYELEKDTEDFGDPNKQSDKQLYECNICKEKYEGNCFDYTNSFASHLF